MKRRDFIKATAAGAAVLALPAIGSSATPARGMHAYFKDEPRAVFIFRSEIRGTDPMPPGGLSSEWYDTGIETAARNAGIRGPYSRVFDIFADGYYVAEGANTRLTDEQKKRAIQAAVSEKGWL